MGRGEGVTKRGRGGPDPLRLLDAAGVLGLVGWAAGAAPLTGAAATAAAIASPAGLVVFGAAVAVRGLDLVLRRRDRRTEARRELSRRLDALDLVVLDLRRALSRDAARRFLDRRAEFVAGVGLAEAELDADQRRLALAAQAVCDDLAEALAGTVLQRVDVADLASALRRDVVRALRRGDLSEGDADTLLELIDAPVTIMDEGVYAEWNADHFGRLAGDRRAFERELGRHDAALAERLERRGLDLYDHAADHVGRKAEAADRLQDWTRARLALQAALAGLPRPTEPAPAPDEPPPARLVAERFVSMGPAPGLKPPADWPRRRLPAAND